MKEPLHIRVFELKGDKYQLPYGGPTVEEYAVEELQNGYVITDMTNFGVDKLRVITYYSPAAAKKYIEAGGIMSDLAEAPSEEV